MLRSLPGAISIHEGTGYLMLGANLASLTLATSPQPTGMASPKVLGTSTSKNAPYLPEKGRKTTIPELRLVSANGPKAQQ